MIKVMTIFGTRPEAIKMLPIIKLIQKENNTFKSIVVVTGQHREMLDQVLEAFDLVPNYNLKIMHPNQTLTEITSDIINELSVVFEIEEPDIVLVHGDTTTTFAASLSAFYHKIPIGHVEAGLRTWDKYSPFPEEMNRQLTDCLSDFYFAPTAKSKLNLIKENHSEKQIFVTGNTVIDALNYSVREEFYHPVLRKLNIQSKIILLTMHRRENQGQPMMHVFQAITQLIKKHKDIEVIFPVHLSPKVQNMAKQYLKGIERVHMVEPLNVIEFHNIIARSYLILTDSGGVQEEAPSLNKPVLILRNETERPEGIETGALKLVGTDPKVIIKEVEILLTNKKVYDKMANAKNPYGDGKASYRILKILKQYFA
ncbi:UDP-N-acetylglucosamine 2-epimerase [Enterococcus faecalis]|uniref:non-hydrolyzing UDP-N-acetylglucosamine 2-epimerase n=1 Tax=Enterococcus faecalis TaxID=1351 RepID=UPI0009C03C77|nr:UDP-N-acetylglucosamine 2-epimerase (non-hydrolyzing) [Enterococcus faecalis]OQO72583.1 UDP-N-acetylglucosamine 2-epimerase [Enterococcus faecalis]